MKTHISALLAIMVSAVPATSASGLRPRSLDNDDNSISRHLRSNKSSFFPSEETGESVAIIDLQTAADVASGLRPRNLDPRDVDNNSMSRRLRSDQQSSMISSEETGEVAFIMGNFEAASKMADIVSELNKHVENGISVSQAMSVVASSSSDDEALFYSNGWDHWKAVCMHLLYHFVPHWKALKLSMLICGATMKSDAPTPDPASMEDDSSSSNRPTPGPSQRNPAAGPSMFPTFVEQVQIVVAIVFNTSPLKRMLLKQNGRDLQGEECQDAVQLTLQELLIGTALIGNADVSDVILGSYSKEGDQLSTDIVVESSLYCSSDSLGCFGKAQQEINDVITAADLTTLLSKKLEELGLDCPEFDGITFVTASSLLVCSDLEQSECSGPEDTTSCGAGKFFLYHLKLSLCLYIIHLINPASWH
jgi:hypothetical protein